MWKVIEEFNHFEINEKGDVRRISNKYVKKHSYSNNRPLVCLWHSGNQRSETRYIHQLIMAAFGSPRPSPEHQIFHLDGDALNFDISNLVWATHLEITHHMFAIGARPNAIGKHVYLPVGNAILKISDGNF